MMRAIAILIIVGLFLGCAGPTKTIMATREGVSKQERSADRLECIERAEAVVDRIMAGRNTNAYDDGFMAAAAVVDNMLLVDNAKNQYEERYIMCMEAKGYTITITNE